MPENNEIIEVVNEEVMEPVVEVVDDVVSAKAPIGKIAAKAGLVIVGGGAVYAGYRYVVRPLWHKLKERRAQRKADKQIRVEVIPSDEELAEVLD